MNKRALGILFVTVFLDLLGFGIVIPLLPLYAETFGANAAVIGWLLASYLIAQALCAPALGRLSDRIGRRPVLLASLAGSSASFFLLGVAPTLMWLFVARVLAGLTGGSISAAKSYIADVTTIENRAKGMGVLGAGIGLGYVFGPAIGGVLMTHSPSLPYFSAGALALLNCLSALAFLPAPPRAPASAGDAEGVRAWAYASRALRHPRLGRCLWIMFFATVTFSLFTGTFALLGERHFAFNARTIGYLLSGAGLVSAIVQGGLIGRLVKRFGELSLVAAGSAMFALSMALTPLAYSMPLMLGALLLLGIGNGLNAPAILALISREASAEEQGRLLGFEQSLESIARIAGLVAGGWLFEHAVGLPYAVGTGLMLAGCVLAAWQMRRPRA
ncbi:MAG: TCR/Tet family MFS transporter [Verrucomicrobia bacterium]|nr:TCR/Tet family MFS transporter [Verrucomicrobiota bacterium]